jgi:hypothetical protein
VCEACWLQPFTSAVPYNMLECCSLQCVGMLFLTVCWNAVPYNVLERSTSSVHLTFVSPFYVVAAAAASPLGSTG